MVTEIRRNTAARAHVLRCPYAYSNSSVRTSLQSIIIIIIMIMIMIIIIKIKIKQVTILYSMPLLMVLSFLD